MLLLSYYESVETSSSTNVRSMQRVQLLRLVDSKHAHDSLLLSWWSLVGAGAAAVAGGAAYHKSGYQLLPRVQCQRGGSHDLPHCPLAPGKHPLLACNAMSLADLHVLNSLSGGCGCYPCLQELVLAVPPLICVDLSAAARGVYRNWAVVSLQ